MSISVMELKSLMITPKSHYLAVPSPHGVTHQSLVVIFRLTKTEVLFPLYIKSVR